MSKFIAKCESFVDQEGAQVDSFECVQGSEEDRPENLPRYTGSAVIGIMGPQGPQPQRVSFPIEAESLEECFEKFKDSLDAYLEELKQESMKKHIVAPTAGETAQIIQP